MRKSKNPLLGIAACLLALSCLLPFASCGKSDAGKGNKPANDSGSEEEKEFSDDLGSFDFGGDTFKVLSVESTAGTYTAFDFAEGEYDTTDHVDSAVYSRNRVIERRFNILFESYTEGQSGDKAGYQMCQERLRTEVNGGGLTGWDLIMLINRDAYTAITEDMICLPYELKYIDMSKDYYLQDVNAAMTIDGISLMAYSDESLYTFERTACIQFNKTEMDKRGMDDPYTLVRNNEWTYQKMFEMVRDAADSETGFYGCSGMADYAATSYWFGCGQKMMTTNEDNSRMIFSIGTNQVIDEVTTALLNLAKDGSMELMAWPGGVDGDSKVISSFLNGNALFYNNIVGKIRYFRDVEWNYGVVPYPKYNAEQDHYYSRVIDAWLHVVPRTCRNYDRASVILEALASGSSQKVFPAYYDKSLEGKYIRNPEDVEMLELIRSHRTFDFADVTWATEIRNDMLEKVFLNRNVSVSTYGQSMMAYVNNSLVKPLMNKVGELKKQSAS